MSNKIKNNKKNGKTSKNVSKESVMISKTEQFSGPLPHPSILAEYQKLIPNAAERFLKLVENESDHRHELVENESKHRQELETNAIKEKISYDKRGQWVCFYFSIINCGN